MREQRVCVLTLDQRRSRRAADAVPGSCLCSRASPAEPLRPFQRTAGDEVQGVLDDALLATEVAGRVLRTRGWSIGIGCGTVAQPLPAETRAGQGDAFVAAREAVTRAKGEVHRLAVTARPDSVATTHLETALGLWAGLIERRTPAGWEAYDELAAGASYGEAGARLGISQSAVSQRARAAGIVDERRARELVSHLWGILLS